MNATKYYRSKITGRIVTDTDLEWARLTYGEGVLILINYSSDEIDNPSVIDILRDGRFAQAVHRYREIHDCSLKEAFDMTRKIRDDLERFQTRQKRYG